MLKKIVREKNFLSFSGNFAFAAVGMVNFLLLTRSYSKTDFGDWVLFVTVVNFLNLFRFGLTRGALVRFGSGASDDERKDLLGASFTIGVLMIVIVAAVCLPSYYLWGNQISMKGYIWALQWYPLLAIVNLSWNNALSYLQVKERFGTILLIRLLNVGSFTIVLLLSMFWFSWTIETILLFYILTNVLSSIVTIVGRWDGLLYMFRSKKKQIVEIFNFGKYSIGSLAGSNLLKSADTFIIGLSPVLGSAGIALYAIPLKLTEILEIPLRSFVATAFPKMSKASMDGNVKKLRSIFYEYSGTITVVFIPAIIINLIFADYFVWILGGKNYKESAELMGNVFRIFAIYGLFLPLDRLTGVALDSINRPKLNFYKVLIMAAANIIGDFIAVFYFESLIAVSVVTLIFTLIGLYFGLYYFNKEIPIRLLDIFKHGITFIKNIKQKL